VQLAEAEGAGLKLCVIGPAYPLRGGIAHHTTLMCRHLSCRHQVDAVTFKRLYPGLLFPGKSQSDPSLQAADFPSAPLLDSMNPLSWLKTADYIRERRPDYVLMQWWQPFFGPCLGTIAARVRPIKTIFICHNIFPHEGGPLARPLARWALRNGGGFVVHSGKEQEILERLLPDRRVCKTVLPEYDVFPREEMGKQAARELLGVRGRVILFFGLVRKYKGLMNLVRAMALLQDMEVTCMVAGEFYDKKSRYISEIDRLALNDVVRIVDEYVPNEQVERYFAAADAVVLPYVSATQSSIVQMAHRFGRPVIATAVGGLPEAVDDGATGLLVQPDSPAALADAIRRFYEESLEAQLTANICADRGRFSWDRVVESIEAIGASL
jgi:glycosyltransferase involved in cell wall biosynthesis